MAAARIQRWELTLSAYSYKIAYKPGSDQANADALSRLPLPDYPKSVPMPAKTLLLMEQLATTPVTATHIKDWTNRDPVLASVKQFVASGWP